MGSDHANEISSNDKRRAPSRKQVKPSTAKRTIGPKTYENSLIVLCMVMAQASTPPPHSPTRGTQRLEKTEHK